jgi:hypothetical protein
MNECAVVVALMVTLLASFSPGYAQLDMTSLTEEQKYTFDKINKILRRYEITSKIHLGILYRQWLYLLS